VASLIWRMPNVCSNFASAVHSASESADGNDAVPSGFVTWCTRSPVARTTAWYFATPAP